MPRAAAFDDRLYRFAGYFAKYALGKFRKRIEHQQRFDLAQLLELFYARGFELDALALVPAGFSWMNDARTKPLQGPFTDAVAWLHRALGIDLGARRELRARVPQADERRDRGCGAASRTCAASAASTR